MISEWLRNRKLEHAEAQLRRTQKELIKRLRRQEELSAKAADELSTLADDNFWREILRARALLRGNDG